VLKHAYELDGGGGGGGGGGDDDVLHHVSLTPDLTQLGHLSHSECLGASRVRPLVCQGSAEEMSRREEKGLKRPAS
jgi:hypothetical protein